MTFFGMDPAVMCSLLSESGLVSRLQDIVIRPGHPDDVDRIMEMHSRLSAMSLYKRYHSPWQPKRANIAWVCHLTGANGRLLVAELPGKQPRIVGTAYYVTSGDGAAEAAFLVEDAFQAQGIGKQLAQRLSQLAVAQGICFFDAYVLTTNRPMIHIIHLMGDLIHNKLDYGSYEMRVKLTRLNQ